MSVLSLTVLENFGGVALTGGDTPQDMSIVSVGGENKLNITWSITPSTTTPSDTVVVRYQASDLTGQPWFVDINWGDGTVDRHAAGWTMDIQAQHTYTAGGAKTISAELVYRFIDITENVDITYTPTLDGDFIVNQVQIEKYEDSILVYEPDWIDVANLPTTYTDDRVNRAFTYKYRYRLRSLDSNQQPLATSQFSSIIEQPSWV